MANLMQKAAQQLRARNEADRRRRTEAKHTELMLIGHGSTLAGGVAAALVDDKWGTETDVAELKGIPTNAILGTSAAVAGVLIGGRAGAGVLGAGVGVLAATVYRLTLDNVDLKKDDE